MVRTDGKDSNTALITGCKFNMGQLAAGKGRKRTAGMGTVKIQWWCYVTNYKVELEDRSSLCLCLSAYK